MKILFVCLGNICRSPIAEGVMKNICVQNNVSWTIDSAGTNNYHTGEPPHKYSQMVCQQHGIDIFCQRAKRFVADDIEKYDIIYALATDVYQEISLIAKEKMDEKKVKLFLDELYPNENKSVIDPWYGTKEGYYPVFEQINMCCEKIFEKYKNH